jgi:hypothetical protein
MVRRPDRDDPQTRAEPVDPTRKVSPIREVERTAAPPH